MFTRDHDQQLFADTTARFLDDHFPISRVRELARRQRSFEPRIWTKSADLGWTALLVPETAGGGSISENGLLDLVIVAAEFGHRAAPGPLFGTAVVAAALGRWGTPEQRATTLSRLVAGEDVTAWAYTSTVDPIGSPCDGVSASLRGDQVILNGTLPYVEEAAAAACILVTAQGDEGLTHYLVPTCASSIDIQPLQSLDMTRRYYQVVLRDVAVTTADQVGEPGTAADHDAALLDLVAVLQLAEITGAMQTAFEMTLQWTADRYSFGRPLASYQEIKHRMADMKMYLEASEAVTRRAAAAVAEGAPDAAAWVSAGQAYVGKYGPELIQDCIQMHGGIGVTFEHDLHVLLRRAVVDAQLFGTPGQFARRLAVLLDDGYE